MDARTFFGLRATDDPERWELPVVPAICSGLGALFGGAALGASVEALELTTGRPLAWATAQFLSYAPPGSLVEIVVAGLVRGHQVSQARAVGLVEGEEIFTVNAALGRREVEFSGSWAVRPDVPPPGACPPRVLMARHGETIMSRIDQRLANARSLEELDGHPGSGNSAFWVQLRDLEISSGSLSIVGDLVPSGLSQALGARAGGSSLDNTIRIVEIVPTEWILADVRVHAVAHGFGHGLVHLWADDGTLLATASQTAIVRRWRDEGDLAK